MPAPALFVSALTRLIFVGIGVAIAIWLIPASVHIVSWPAAGPVRLALLAPLTKLTIALAATAAVLGAAALVASACGRLIAFSSALAPLLALWLWALPYLPWVPDRAPLLMIFAGPIRWIVVALAVIAVFQAAISGGRIMPGWQPGRRVVFGISLAVCLAAGFAQATAVGPTGDEPHYLIITHSLLVDRDLDIANNHERGDYRAFYPGELRPDFLQRGRRGEIYSIHAPGLPALLVPAYAIAGYRGAVAFMCLLAALAALAIFDLADAVTGRAAALLTWAAVCFSVPFVPNAWLLFPEMPATLVAAWSALWLARPAPERAVTWLGRGIALASLPWLHTKFITLLAALAVCLVVRAWPRVRAAFWLAAPIAGSAALWLMSFYSMYGVVDPRIAYGAYAASDVVNRNIPRGVLGLLFDQKFGLLAYSPVYLLAPVGCWMMLRSRDRRWFAAGLAACAAAFVLSSARVYMWWGGLSAPARFLVPILPLLAPMMAHALAELRASAVRPIALVLVGASVLVGAAGIAAPGRQYLFSDAHGFARLAEVVQAGAPLTDWLPTFTDENWHAPLRLLFPWLAGAAIALPITALIVARGRASSAWFRAAVAGLPVLLATVSLIAPGPSAASRLATVNRGHLELMRRLDARRLVPFSYAHFASVDDRQLAEICTLVWRRTAEQPLDDPRRVVGPVELPPGRYDSHIWLEEAPGPDGFALVTLRNPDVVLARAAAAQPSNPIDLPFDVDFDTDLWIGVSSSQVATRIRRVDLTPVRIVPASQRAEIAARAVEPIPGWPGALVVYADDNTFPEGGVYWTRGAEPGRVFVERPGARTIALTLHVGPNGGLVRIAVAGQDASASLAPGETRQIQVPIATEDRLVAIDVRAPAAFRPADVERGSADRRWLGCQVRVELR